MSDILLISDENYTKTFIKTNLKQYTHNIICATSEAQILNLVQTKDINLVIYDSQISSENIIVLMKKLKIALQSEDISSILLLKDTLPADDLKLADFYIQKPIDKNILIATVNSALHTKETFQILSKNNSNLAKSLYQLNMLYNTSIQLAGTLDKTKLINYVIDGLEQGLSLSLAYILILNEEKELNLIIKSVHPISKRLENAIKLRAILNYKNLFSINPQIDNIQITKTIKDQYGEYDLNIFKFDNLFAPFNIKNKFYGIIEVFRDTDFEQDDTKCFTTLVKQVSLPLESAILYEELKDTNIKLEKLERLKSEFISIVSHELRTPLTSINSAIEIILKGATGQTSEATNKFLNLAKRNITRLSAIIKDLLDMSKIEAGKMDFKFEKANINNPIELVKNALENIAKEQNIEINLNLGENLDLVYIDTQRIEQVLTNLVSNAIKFTDKNGKITITSSKISGNELQNIDFLKNSQRKYTNEYIKVDVKDTGIGIAKENLTKVFDQFKQIENSLDRKVGGSGLGLPIAKKLIETHKGFIWVDSELDKGSTFSIAIPILTEEEIFILSLSQDIIKAKQDHVNIGLVALREDILDEVSIINKILNENILRKTSIFKDYSCIKNNKKYYFSYAYDMDSFVLDFENRQLASYIEDIKKELPEYDIVYSTVLFPRDAETTEELIQKLISSFEGVSYEENFDS